MAAADDFSDFPKIACMMYSTIPGGLIWSCCGHMVAIAVNVFSLLGNTQIKIKCKISAPLLSIAQEFGRLFVGLCWFVFIVVASLSEPWSALAAPSAFIVDSRLGSTPDKPHPTFPASKF